MSIETTCKNCGEEFDARHGFCPVCEPEGWRPISEFTYPKDGWFGLVHQDGAVRLHYWSGYRKQWEKPAAGRLSNPLDFYDECKNPTHWMELPPNPPAEDDDEPDERLGLLDKWREGVIAKLEEAGFSVSVTQEDEIPGGLPIVPVPETLGEKVRLLKLRLPGGGMKNIFADGVIITPPGM